MSGEAADLVRRRVVGGQSEPAAPAPVPSPVWPDDATIEQARQAVLDMLSGVLSLDGAETAARAVLATVDPSGDTKLLAQVREIVAEAMVEIESTFKDRYSDLDTKFTAIAALLAGGET